MDVYESGYDRIPIKMTHDGKPVDKAPFAQLTIEQHDKCSVANEAALNPMMPELVDSKFLGVRFPTCATPRVLGVRCLTMIDGRPVDMNKNGIWNKHICDTLESYGMSGLDGVLKLNGDATYVETEDAVMEKSGKPDFTYYVFDLWNRPHLTYSERVRSMKHIITDPHPPEIEVLYPSVVYDTKGLMNYWNRCADYGFDGTVMRFGGGYYAWWTHLKGDLKIFSHYRRYKADVVGFEQDGNTGNLRGFKCKNALGQTFSVRAGFTRKQRKDYWDTRTIQVGNRIWFTTQPGTCAPRHPVFIRIDNV